MRNVPRLIGALIASVIGIIVMVVLATVVFFITTFVVSTGAGLAGYEPSGDFVVLAAALIVVAVIITGGFTPRLAESSFAAQSQPPEDPMYD